MGASPIPSGAAGSVEVVKVRNPIFYSDPFRCSLAPREATKNVFAMHLSLGFAVAIRPRPPVIGARFFESRTRAITPIMNVPQGLQHHYIRDTYTCMIRTR